MIECQQIISEYMTWLRKGLSADCIEHICELTTPFLDRHNDHLQIYAQKKNETIILSDDGYILADLRTSGFEALTPKRKIMLETILNGFGVKTDGGRLYVEASPQSYGQKMHSLIQAMISVNDLFVLAQPRVASYFWEDVKSYLDANNVRFSSRVKITGRSGYDHAVDFLIPKSQKYPERIVQVINAPDRNTISSYLFTLEDTQKTREEGTLAFAFLNDQQRTASNEVVEALKVYQVVPALWSKRGEHIERLAG